jgi:hypothetical protein
MCADLTGNSSGVALFNSADRLEKGLDYITMHGHVRIVAELGRYANFESTCCSQACGLQQLEGDPCGLQQLERDPCMHNVHSADNV